MTRDESLHGEVDRRGHIYAEGPTEDDPPGTNRELGTDQGRQVRAKLYGDGSRHAAQGAETSGKGWQVAGGEKVQVDSDPLQESICGASERER